MSSVDVVIPCYKYGHYLRQCVESVLQQEGVDVRVLIIDDCSPDNTPEVGQQLAAEDSRVEYRRHVQNKGHIATYNEGLLEWASADYSLLLSADDLLAPGALQRATRLMDTYPKVVMTYGRATIVQREKPLPDYTLHSQAETFQIGSGPSFISYCCETLTNPVPTPTAVVRTGVQQAIGGYRIGLPHSGDMEMWMRFALQGEIGVLNAHQALYSVHGQNMNISYQREGLKDLPEIANALNDLFGDANDLTSDYTATYQHAISSIAWRAFWLAYNAWDAGDVAMCRKCMSFAQSVYPEIVSNRAWKNQLWKLRFGPHLAGLLRSLKSWMGRSIVPSANEPRNSVIGSRQDSICWSGWQST